MGGFSDLFEDLVGFLVKFGRIFFSNTPLALRDCHHGACKKLMIVYAARRLFMIRSSSSPMLLHV